MRLGLVLGVLAGVIATLITSTLPGFWTRWSWTERGVLVVLAIVVLIVFLAGDRLVDSLLAAWRSTRPVSLVVQLHVRGPGEQSWSRSAFARPGDVLEYQLRIKNAGPGTAMGLIAGVNLAPHSRYVPGSVRLKSGVHPQGIELVDRADGGKGHSLFHGGIDIGNYAPRSVSYVLFKAQVRPTTAEGEHTFRTVGVGRVPRRTNEIFNTSDVGVEVGLDPGIDLP